jgi:hypothetical protein
VVVKKTPVTETKEVSEEVTSEKVNTSDIKWTYAATNLFIKEKL